MKTVFLFPGQGVQAPGMGKGLYSSSAEVRQFFQRCSDILHMDLPKLLFESSAEELQRTENTQIAVTTVNLAAALVLQEQGIEPTALAGFSLGEYASLVLAGVLSVDTMFTIVRKRGVIMEEKSRVMEQRLQKAAGSAASAEACELGMTAILGLHPDTIAANLQKWNTEHVFLSMYNSPVQGVIAGTRGAREETAERLKAEGAKRAVPLKVKGPFHTKLMQEAREAFAEVLQEIEFKDPTIPIYSNVTAAPVSSGAELRTLYIDQIVSPVRWLHEMEAIWRNEAPEQLFEVGPGTVLSGLWRKWRATKNEEEIPDIKNTEA